MSLDWLDCWNLSLCGLMDSGVLGSTVCVRLFYLVLLSLLEDVMHYVLLEGLMRNFWYLTTPAACLKQWMKPGVSIPLRRCIMPWELHEIAS